MAVTAAQIKELRQATGVGMLECKKALEEAKGDYKEALTFLRERGLAKAAKKSGRAAAEGIVEFAINAEHTAAAMVELNCETDFAAKNAAFREFATVLAKLALDKKTGEVSTLSGLKLPDSENTVDEHIKQLVSSIGENIMLRRAIYMENGDDFICGYNHMQGKIGSLVVLEGNRSETAAAMGVDLAMHVAACSPRYFTSDDVDPEDLAEEKRVIRSQLEQQGKPAAMIDKIMAGQVKKFFADNCFLQQAFVKDPKQTVEQFVSQTAKGVDLKSYVRFQLGEGVEVKASSFAEEVASLTK